MFDALARLALLSSGCRFVCFPGHSTHLAAAASAEREREREREKERERLAAASSDLYLRPGGWRRRPCAQGGMPSDTEQRGPCMCRLLRSQTGQRQWRCHGDGGIWI